MPGIQQVPWGVIIAAVGGLAIGVEREWSGHAIGPNARFAGVRTFTLLGGVGGLAGWLWSIDVTALSVVVLASASALVVAAYVAASRSDVDGTTEVSALVVLAAGVLAGLGYHAIGSGIVTVTAMMLLEKTRLHALVRALDDEELRAAMRFAVMAVVVLPLLPVGPYGPWEAVRPRELWLCVLLFSGLSFIAYIARRVVGVDHGYTVAGIVGGVISSTSVTLTFARASRDAEPVRANLAYGTIAASTVLFVRVLVAVSILNPALLSYLAAAFAVPFAWGAAMVLRGARTVASVPERENASLRNPLQFRMALQMTALFQIVLVGVMLTDRLWGELGVTAAGAFLGLADVDALTLSMARHAGATISADIAARAIAIGVLANLLLKLALAATVGRGTFRRLSVRGLAGLGAALGVSIAVVGWYR